VASLVDAIQHLEKPVAPLLQLLHFPADLFELSVDLGKIAVEIDDDVGAENVSHGAATSWQRTPLLEGFLARQAEVEQLEQPVTRLGVREALL
jgi:hypothetical protein